MNVEELKALPPEAKSIARRRVRRMLTHTLRAVRQPQTAERRSYLSGYLDFARKALEALNERSA